MTITTDVGDTCEASSLNTINAVEESQVKTISTNILWAFIENMKHCYDMLQNEVEFLPQTTPLKDFSNAKFSEFKRAFVDNKSTWYVHFYLPLFELSMILNFKQNTMTVWVQSAEGGFCIVLDDYNLKILGGSEWTEELYRRREKKGRFTKSMCNLPCTFYMVSKLTDVLHSRFGNNIFNKQTAIELEMHFPPPFTRTRLSYEAFKIGDTVMNQVYAAIRKAIVTTDINRQHSYE